MSGWVAQRVGHRAEVVTCQSPPVLQWAVSLMAGSQRESPETVGWGKDRERECCLYLFIQVKDVRVGLENPDLQENKNQKPVWLLLQSSLLMSWWVQFIYRVTEVFHMQEYGSNVMLISCKFWGHLWYSWYGFGRRSAFLSFETSCLQRERGYLGENEYTNQINKPPAFGTTGSPAPRLSTILSFSNEISGSKSVINCSELIAAHRRKKRAARIKSMPIDNTWWIWWIASSIWSVY